MFEVRIIDKSKYPYDFNAVDYFSVFSGDEINGLDDYKQACLFVEIFNKHEKTRRAYIWTDK